MGLYLTIFDKDKELEGIEIGSYSDLEKFKILIAKTIENGKFGSKYPVFMLHNDSDGEWSAQEAVALEKELVEIQSKFKKLPPFMYKNCWQELVIKSMRLKTRNLQDCFFDIDGEPLFDRLIALTRLSQRTRLPILFQ